MSAFKEVMNRVEDNRLDSMFYKSSDHTPLRRVSFREREWVIEPFGEVRLTYKDERYYLNEDLIPKSKPRETRSRKCKEKLQQTSKERN